MEWQPIAAAPKDGTIIIVRGFQDAQGRTPMLAAAAQWVGQSETHGLWMRDNNGYGFTVSCSPTHWMPLLRPPARGNDNNG